MALSNSQYTTSFTFNSFVGVTLQGDAHVPSGSTFLRLTGTDACGNPKTWSTGRVLYSRPVQLWTRSPARQANFETTISFVIKPSTNGAADGIAFFIAPVGTSLPSDSAGANLGIFSSSCNNSPLFAIKFDTYPNCPGPDPNYRHIGIHINSREPKANTRFDSAVGEVVTARINYEPTTTLISVVATCGSQTATLTYKNNLKCFLPEQVQVGISSATGQFVSQLGVHDIHSWYFTSTLVPEIN